MVFVEEVFLGGFFFVHALTWRYNTKKGYKTHLGVTENVNSPSSPLPHTPQSHDKKMLWRMLPSGSNTLERNSIFFFWGGGDICFSLFFAKLSYQTIFISFRFSPLLQLRFNNEKKTNKKTWPHIVNLYPERENASPMECVSPLSRGQMIYSLGLFGSFFRYTVSMGLCISRHIFFGGFFF